jgi:hypothetical protein
MPSEWRRRSGAKPTPKSARELLARELPPAKWAVPGVLPEGITILAGKPKMGKSWLALGLCVAVTSGGYALGKIPVGQGAALYLALEDTDRRLQKRLRKVLAGSECPDGLDYETEWDALTEGGVEAIREWIDQRPDARLIVIDILKRVRSREQAGRSMYDVDYEALEPLKPLVEEHGVSILVIHHLRQLEAADPLEMISGSSGLTGVADGALVLKRDRGKQDATLHIDGRDVEEPTELALRWDADIASWSLMGDAEEFRISNERREILDALTRAGVPLAPKEIAERIDKPDGNVRKLLHGMRDDGQVVQHGTHPRYKYTPTGNGNDGNDGNDGNEGNDSNVTNVTGSSEGGNDKNTENTAYLSQKRRNVTDVTVVTGGVGGRKGNVTEDAGESVTENVTARRLTAEEGNKRVQRLIDEGMAPKLAVAEVLGEGGKL